MMITLAIRYRKGFIRSLIILITALISLPVRAATEPLFEKTDLFEEGKDGFTLYRIPGIVVTAKGTVLAYCEARKFTEADRGEIEIHMRRSTDGGHTWSPAKQVAHLGPRLPRNPHLPNSKLKKDMGGPDEQTVNNPVAIAGRDGTVHLIYCVEYMRCFHIRSEDDGITWSKPVEITATFDQFRSEFDWQAIAPGPGHAIQLKSGRLILAFWMATYDKKAKLGTSSGVVFSDDNGLTWQRGDIAIQGGEPNIAELADGRVLVTAKNGDPRNRRKVAFSTDGVTGWSQPEFIEDLLEPGCKAGLVSHPGTADTKKPFLLFSSPDTTERDHQSRVDVTVKLSYDDGLTWPVGRLLQPGPSAYSDLAVLPDGTVLCFYESGTPEATRQHGRPWAYASLTVARFNIAWLMGGENTGNEIRKKLIRK
jgi:sialidase-1